MAVSDFKALTLCICKEKFCGIHMYLFKAIAEAVILGGVLWQCEFLRLLLYVYSTVQ